MYYNSKIEALSGSMERYISSRKHQKPYRLYQGDKLVFESIFLEEVEEEMEDILKEQGVNINLRIVH